jgi:4-cresol dehydrogenase (hydroxylating)
MLDRTSFDAFFAAAQRELDAGALDGASETQRRYGETTMPSGDRRVRGVVFPRSAAEVQTVVRLANEHHVPLYPISAGNNIGLGNRSPVSDGQVVVDLGRHMNRILEINDELGYAVIEPGVSFQALHDELVRRSDRLMISATSGPPAGSILGNALDKGGGYGPAFDHFGSLCGLEAVLGNASVLRTGGGSLDQDESVDRHVSKYSFGPILDGLFAQSNYGIVTRAAVWLMPRPPVIESFHLLCARDQDLGPVIDLIRPLKLSGFVPTLFRVTSDVYAAATEDTSPDYRPGLGQALSGSAREALRDRHDLGAWHRRHAVRRPRRSPAAGAAASGGRLDVGAAERCRAVVAPVAAGWRHHLVHAGRADDRYADGRARSPEPRDLCRAWHGPHGDACRRRAVCAQLACDGLQPRTA